MGEPFGKGWRRFRTRKPQPGPEGSSDDPRRRRAFREPGRGARPGEAGEWATPSLAALPASSGPGLERPWVATRRAPRGRGPPVGVESWWERLAESGGRWLCARIPCAALLRCPPRRSWGHLAAEGARPPRPTRPSACSPGLWPRLLALLRLGNWNLKWFVFPHCSCSASGESS